MDSVNAGHGMSNSRSSIGAATNPNTLDLQFNSKLQKLDFPVFKGNPIYWTTFWDQFKTSTHLNSRLSDIDKFNYLKKYLDGQALSAISGLTMSSENYHEAIDLLKNRLGNTQTLISAHMETSLNVNKVRNFDDMIALKNLYNDVETCVRNLKTLIVEAVTYGYLFMPSLKARLPDTLVMIIARKFGENISALDLVLKYFHKSRDLGNCFETSYISLFSNN